MCLNIRTHILGHVAIISHYSYSSDQYIVQNKQNEENKNYYDLASALKIKKIRSAQTEICT